MADDNAMQEHFSYAHDKLDKIEKEVSKMSDGNYDSGVLTGMLANRGIDPGIIAMLNDRAKSGFGEGGLDWLVLLFLFFICAGGNGFGARGPGGAGNSDLGIDRTIFNQSNYGQLMDAISTQGSRQDLAISQLAQNLNVSDTAVRSALDAISRDQAVNRGDIKSAIQSCCCSIRTEMQSLSSASQLQASQNHDAVMQGILDAKYHINERTAGTNSLIQDKFADQTLQIQQAFSSQNAYLAEQFCAIKNREDAREIQALRDKLQEQREQANTLAIINSIQSQRLNASGILDTTAGTWSGNVVGQ